VNADLADVLEAGDKVAINRAIGTIEAAGVTFKFAPLSPSVQAILDAGGLVPMLQQRFKK